MTEQPCKCTVLDSWLSAPGKIQVSLEVDCPEQAPATEITAPATEIPEVTTEITAEAETPITETPALETTAPTPTE